MSLKEWWHKHSDEMFASDDQYKFAEMLWETARREILLDVAKWDSKQLGYALAGAELEQAIIENDLNYINSRLDHLEFDKSALNRAKTKLEDR